MLKVSVLKSLVILSITCSLQAVMIVHSSKELESAIHAANAGAETRIEFGSSFSYDQPFPPLNADNILQPTNQTFIIDGKGFTLTQTGTAPGFFIRESTGTITIQNLTINGAQALGGDSSGGGGGLGAGGGVFLNAGSSVILDNVVFEDCESIGGASPEPSHTPAGVGGGGFRGSGGLGDISHPDGGGGGGGAVFRAKVELEEGIAELAAVDLEDREVWEQAAAVFRAVLEAQELMLVVVAAQEMGEMVRMEQILQRVVAAMEVV